MPWNKNFTRSLGRAALAALAAITITGCFAQPASPITAPTTAPTTAATVIVPTAGAPTTSVPTTGVPTAIPPTAVLPTSGAPTTQPRPDPSRGLVGPEWIVAAAGDFDRNGAFDVVAYKPQASVVLAFTPEPSDRAYVISELVVVEQRADGSPWVRLAVSLDNITADGQALGRFGSGALRPAAHLVRMLGADRKLAFSPLNSAGQQYAQEAAVVWDDAAKAYRIAVPGGGQPNPLVGTEWTVALSGDFNSNGLEDVVAYKPATVQPDAGGNPGGVLNLAVRELVVAERRADGGVAVRLWVDSGSVRIDGNPIHVFTPAGAGVIAQSNDDGRIELLPFDAAGVIYPSDVTVGWSPEINAFRVIPKLPADPLYVGPDWTLLARGDLNNDGLLDGVQFLPLSIQLVPSAGMFAGYVTAREALIIQVDQYNEQKLMASVASDSAVINGQTVYRFGDGSAAQIPAGYLVGSGGGAAMTVIPLTADGNIAGPALAFIWDAATGSYRVETRPL